MTSGGTPSGFGGIITKVSPQLRELGHLGNYLSEASLVPDQSSYFTSSISLWDTEAGLHFTLYFRPFHLWDTETRPPLLVHFVLPPHLADATSPRLDLYIVR
jgi:hypothetical protein